jgi:hypothetical protein
MTSPRLSSHATVTLRLDLGAETISGTLDDGSRGELLFWGWLELSDRLDEVGGVTPTFRGSGTQAERRPRRSSDTEERLSTARDSRTAPSALAPRKCRVSAPMQAARREP